MLRGIVMLYGICIGDERAHGGAVVVPLWIR
jgi:hypothetical protein